MNLQHIKYRTHFPSVLLALLLIFALSACSVTPNVTYGDAMPSLSDDELPDPQEMAPPDDITDYPALAAAVFEGVDVVPASELTYQSTVGGICLTAYNGEREVIVLPDAIDGTPVVALGDAMFKGNTTIKAISIPNSVQTIGKELLNGCRSLQVIKTPQMGETRTSDGFLAYLFGGSSAELGAFKIGSALDTVILTDQVSTLSPLAFYGAYRLIMVILPDTLTSVGNYAFSGCSALKYAALPEGVTTIGEGAFSDCTSLTSFTVPDSVQSIGCGAFMDCKSLISLSIPFTGESADSQENTHFGYIFGAEAYVFNSDFLPAALRYVTVRHGDLANYAFYECDQVYLVTLPEDCKQIGVRTFHGCSSLLSVALPDTVTHIGDMAFSDCVWLNKITFGKGIVEIGMQAFMGCINLKEITLPASLTMLAPSTFAGCKRLRSVTLGDALTTVDDAVFRNCISLSEVKNADGSKPSASKLAIGNDNDALILCLNP